MSSYDKLRTRTLLQKDADGNVILKPVLGWNIASVAEVAILIQMLYSDGPEDVSKGANSIQFVLTPEVCIQLAAEIAEQARRLLTEKLPPSKLPN
jgi:hypothetical protein